LITFLIIRQPKGFQSVLGISHEELLLNHNDKYSDLYS
jgi:hypothetical protein